jgi:hypothetical protein
MDRVNVREELGKAAVASVVAFFVALVLRGLGAGKWLIAAGSGAAGGVVALAVFA